MRQETDAYSNRISDECAMFKGLKVNELFVYFDESIDARIALVQSPMSIAHDIRSS